MTLHDVGLEAMLKRMENFALTPKVGAKINEHRFPVLIAEDNPISRRLLEKILIKTGHEVVSVDNGYRAFDLFNERFFPIIITDWMMPAMSGLELCKAIRKRKNEGYVYIVLLTARDSSEDIIAGLEAGADDFLVKPFNRGELIARLNTGKRFHLQEMALKRANEEIKRLAMTDPLTGCYNRSVLTDRLPQEIRRAKRYNRSLSLVLCDIDHFKKINDTYGHQTGDVVLQEFAALLKSSIRYDSDWMVRYGGEEFLIVLPETPPKGACCMAEHLRTALAQTPIETQGNRIHLTASFGVAGFDCATPDEEISPDRMIKQADKNLYQAKEEGRNRVIACTM